MLRIASIFVLFGIFSTQVVSTPVERSGTVSTQQKRTPGSVYLCTDLNFGGHCSSISQGLNTCVALGSDFSGQVSSFGPDDCAQCTGYSGSDCSGASWSIIYPGDPTGGLGTTNPWNDKIQSFKCSSLAC